MKILVIATWYPHEENPAEAPFNAEHVEAIRGQGHQVRVVHVRLGTALAMPKSVNGVWEGIPVRRVAADPRRPGTVLACERLLTREMGWADVVHTMAFSSILLALPAWSARTATGRGRPWVHTEHWNGVVNPSSVSPLWEKLSGLRRVLRFPHVVTGVTGQLAAEMQRFARPDAARVVPCVVKGRGTVAASVFGTPLRLVAVGGLIDRKRPLATIETLAWLRDHGTDAHLTWVGDGPQRAECEALVAKLDLADRVTLAGSVRPAEVAEHLSAADLFFLPTAQENFFTSAAEALAAGRAVVATRVGGFSDYADASNSRLVDDVTPEVLGRAVLDAAEAFRNVSAGDIAAPIRARFAPAAVGELFDDAYAAAIARA
ncbi:glycosyltransferase [Arthrobacter livingstonensis]|uniref:Glycosyltransferase n=1 Tax=Arthrobacter livingstonensis TaxID=670078 RepID=A0A2V5LC73_9MICC|nr:glycosyltransferase [Arthrobacter livingstonensis]PYI69241.1 glycosyltransferase [Arthrobacter livingstonensis]